MDKFKEDMRKRATLLKLALRIKGFRHVDPVEGIGTTIKENVNGLYLINNQEDDRPQTIPNEFTLFENITTKLVMNRNSYFSLRGIDGDHYIFSDFVPEPLLKVEFTRRPKHYSMFTSKGVPMKNIGQVMGIDCLAIAVSRRCSFFNQKKPCLYCNIDPTNVQSKLPALQGLDDLGELIKCAGDSFRFIDLTGGTFHDTDEECKRYTEMGEVIKENLRKPNYSGPFSLTPPKNISLLERLHKTGVDVISFNIDIWEDNALRRICPGKYAIGKEHYERALVAARDLWGPGNSVIQFLAGPWESNESILEATKYFLDRGILVNITSYYPSPNSPIRNGKAKGIADLVDLYIDYGHLVRESGLYPNSRNSILTSPSGNRSSISNEVARGYLTRENYNQETDLSFTGGHYE